MSSNPFTTSTSTSTKYGTIPTSSTHTSTPTPSAGAFLTRAANQTQTLISYRRPWREFFSLSFLSLPSSYSDAMSRIRRNLNYFRFNYSLIVLIILFLSLIYHPISMIVFLIIFLLWLFLYLSRDQPIEVFHRRIDDRIVLGFLGFVTILCLVLTHVGVNVLVALAVGVLVIGLHAAFRNVDDLFLDEDDFGDSGLPSVVDGQPLRPTYGGVV